MDKGKNIAGRPVFLRHAEIVPQWVGALTLVFGLFLYLSLFGDALKRWSFDSLVLVNQEQPTDEVLIIRMDEISYKLREQPFNKPWDRALHAQLLERLTKAGAQGVVFDIVFSDKGPNPAADQALADAIAANQRVILGADVSEAFTPDGLSLTVETPPYEPFLDAAYGYGLVTSPISPDMVIRQITPPTDEQPTLAGNAAKMVHGFAFGTEKGRSMWLRYYGPPGAIRSVSYNDALHSDAVADEVIRGKVVFVGQHLGTDSPGVLKDEFGTAYTWFSGSFSSGTEVHASAYLNLVHGDWLILTPVWIDVLIALFMALLAYGLAKLPPAKGLLLISIGVICVVVIVALTYRYGRSWHPWLIPVAQAMFATALAVPYRLIKTHIDKQVLESSLSYYMSKQQVEIMVNSPELLKPGGNEQDVSVIFTDIANFSTISETMPPKILFDRLNEYYDAALESVHRTEGTMIQLIGDAILAVWNAPLPQTDHKLRACHAALQLKQHLLTFDANHRDETPMFTRVGLHSGIAPVGNLGSRQRFDYAVIGASVNMASRLEGLNKHLNTQVLASQAVQVAAADQMIWRRVGLFRLKGSGSAMVVFELIGALDCAEKTKPWRDAFEDAVFHYQRGRFEDAENLFQQTITLRNQFEKGKDDGPSSFYLKKLAQQKGKSVSDTWTGEIVMDEK